MTFDVIFSLTTLAAYLRYPQIEGLGDELLPEGSRVQLTRKRNGIDFGTSRPSLPKGKKSKVSSEVLPITTSESSKHPHVQLSFLKEMAFPRKSRYDKGKHKINPSFLEDAPLVNSFSPLRAKGGKRKTMIFDLLTGTRPSREVNVSIKESNPLIIPSREITLIAEESNSSVPPSFGMSHPSLLSSTTNPTKVLTIREIQETPLAEAEAMEPSASNEMDKGGASSSLPEIADDDEVTGFPKGNSSDDQIFAANPISAKPSNSRTSKESIKFFGRTMNWVGDPLKAFADLIPVNSATDAVTLPRKEVMDNMFHHLVDVSLFDFLFFSLLSRWIRLMMSFIQFFLLS
jgi:hypothetical protein